MSLILTLPLLLSLATAPGTNVPRGVSAEGLMELTQKGELILLPRHSTSPFHALIVTRSSQRCSSLEEAMLSVERYPERWSSIKEVRVQTRTPTRVEYEFDMDFVFSPTIKGKVERPRAGTVVFHDIDTGGRFTWSLEDVRGDCHVVYRLYQPQGKSSGFVSLITAVESGAGDSGELAGAIASARGYMKPELEVKHAVPLSVSGRDAWDRLAAEGTVLRVERQPGKPTVVVSRRRTNRPATEVLWSIRDRRRYAQKIDIVRKVKDRGAHVDWTFGYFGGRVSVTTAIQETGSVASADGVQIRERVTGGDLDVGEWRWRVREVPGGTEVELTIDLDISAGSLVLRSLAAQDPMIRDAGSLQLALSMMGSLVGGKLLPIREGPPVAVK